MSPAFTISPSPNMDRADHARLIGLNYLRIARRDDLALGHGDDVDGAQRGPYERDNENGGDHVAPQPPDGRRGRLDDFEGGGKEFPLMAADRTRGGRFDR